MSEQIKTDRELDALKRQWQEDPHWDIEETEGFEFHRESLKAFRLEVEQNRKDLLYRRMTDRAGTLNCSLALLHVIEGMERRIKRLEGDK